MNLLKTLNNLNVIKHGHFLLPSGKHSNIYFQCAKLFEFPSESKKVLKVLTNKLKYLDFDIIVGPAIGGIIMSYELARQLNKPFIYIERKNGVMCLSDIFKNDVKQRVLIAEDVITSGKTVKESIRLIEDLCGEVVGIACVVNKENININKKIFSCLDFNHESFETNNCPFCKNNIPLQSGK